MGVLDCYDIDDLYKAYETYTNDQNEQPNELPAPMVPERDFVNWITRMKRKVAIERIMHWRKGFKRVIEEGIAKLAKVKLGEAKEAD